MYLPVSSICIHLTWGQQLATHKVEKTKHSTQHFVSLAFHSLLFDHVQIYFEWEILDNFALQTQASNVSQTFWIFLYKFSFRRNEGADAAQRVKRPSNLINVHLTFPL